MLSGFLKSQILSRKPSELLLQNEISLLNQLSRRYRLSKDRLHMSYAIFLNQIQESTHDLSRPHRRDLIVKGLDQF